MINIGIIGVGYWGPNYARLCHEVDNVNLIWFSDSDEGALKKIKQRYPSVKITSDNRKLAEDPNLDAVVVTTPAQTHFLIVEEFLKAGKHVLVEKPMTAKFSEAKKLQRLVKKSGKILMVDHTFKYNAGIIKLKEMIKSGELGRIYYITASYSALGPIRKDIDALWDLGPHWIYTLNYLLDSFPISVEAKGGRYLKKGMNDVAFLNFEYPKKILANLHVTWLYPKKERFLTVAGDKKMAIFDDVSSDNRLIVYDRGFSINGDKKDPNFANLQIILRDGDVVIPKVENKEPLKEALKHFLNCIEEGKKPLSDVDDGAKTVEILEKASLSIKKNGSRILISE